MAVVAGLERHGHRPRRPRLARLPADLDTHPFPRSHQKQILNLVGAIDGIHGERLARRECRRLASGREPFDSAREGEGHRGKPLGNEKLIRSLSIFKQLKVHHFLDGGDAIEIDRLNRQCGFFEEPQRHRLAIDKERGPDDHFRGAPRPQALPIDMNPCPEFVRFAPMVEEVEARDLCDGGGVLGGGIDPGGADHDRLSPWSSARRDQDRAVVTTGKLLTVKQEPGMENLAAGVVENREPLASAGIFHQRPEPALANQSPARATVADEVHDIHPRLRKLGQIDVAEAPRQRVVVGSERQLDCRSQAVERDISIDLLQLAAVMAEGIDLEDPDCELRNILHHHIERHGSGG